MSMITIKNGTEDEGISKVIKTKEECEKRKQVGLFREDKVMCIC